MRERILFAGVIGGCLTLGSMAGASTLFLNHFDSNLGGGAGTADYAVGDPTEQIGSPGGPGGTIVSSPAEFGNALQRNSPGGRVEYSTAGNWNPNVGTIEMWVNSATLTSNGFVGLWGTDTGTGNGTDDRMYIYPVGGVETLGAYMNGGGGTFWECEMPIPTNLLTNNAWHSVAWEYDTTTGVTATFWDGQLLRNTPDSGVVNPHPATNTLFHIGENQSGSATFPGYIDEFRISDTVVYPTNANYTPQIAPFAVPEPGSLTLLGAGSLFVLRRRRKN
jgi:hypothetical protein